MRPLTVALDALAVYRLTRLIVADGIFTPVRGWLSFDKNLNVRERWAYFLGCRFCVGLWVAVLVTLARWTVPTQWNVAAYALAVSVAAPLLARLEPQDD